MQAGTGIAELIALQISKEVNEDMHFSLFNMIFIHFFADSLSLSLSDWCPVGRGSWKDLARRLESIEHQTPLGTSFESLISIFGLIARDFLF